MIMLGLLTGVVVAFWVGCAQYETARPSFGEHRDRSPSVNNT